MRMVLKPRPSVRLRAISTSEATPSPAGIGLRRATQMRKAPPAQRISASSSAVFLADGVPMP